MISWDEWEKTYRPSPNPASNEEEVFWQAWYENLSDIPKDIPNERIWTNIDGDGMYMHLVSGIHIINRLGYMVSEVPWTEDVFVSNQKEF